MKARITVAVNPGLKDLPKQLTEWSDAEMKKVRNAMDKTFRKQRSEVFATEGVAARWKKWDPLSDEYAKQKRGAASALRERKRQRSGRALKGSISNKIMQYSGKLKRSLTQKGGDHVAKYTVGKSPHVVLGTKNVVAAYHAAPKDGMSNPLYNRKMPDRDVMEHRDVQVNWLRWAYRPIWTAKVKRIERFLLKASAEMRRRTAARGGF